MSSNTDGGELVPSCNTVAFGTAPPSRLQLSRRRRPNHLAGKTGTLSLNPFVDLVAMINGSDGVLVNISQFLQPVEVVSFAIAASVNKVVIKEVKKSLDELYVDDIISIFGFIPPKILRSIRNTELSMIVGISDYAGRFGREPLPVLSSSPTNELCVTDETNVDLSFNRQNVDAITSGFGALNICGYLIVDMLANIFAFLPLEEIMRLRRVHPRWRDAVRNTTVPPTIFDVNSVERYNAMVVMMAELPNLHQIIGLRLGDLGEGHMWRDGQDPTFGEFLQRRESFLRVPPAHDTEIIFGFRKLQILEIDAWLNGIYPGFFNFPCLQKLTMDSSIMKWDLTMLAGLPVLKELVCSCADNMSHCMTGNISSLRVLKETLEKVIIDNCENVVGNFMDLADFPLLKCLRLTETAVSGDIRDIGDHDFVALEEQELHLPMGVYGGHEFRFRAVSHVRNFFQRLEARVIRLLPGYYSCYLSEDSPDWYHGFPFYVELVGAGSWPGSIAGWRWTKGYSDNDACEVNWIYGEYIDDYETIRYRGFFDPPTREEYLSLSRANLW